MQLGGPVFRAIRYPSDWLKSDFLRKVIETYFVQIISLGINFLSIVFFSRILGPTARGVLATSMAVVAMGVQFGNMGLHVSNTYYVAQDRSELPVIFGNTCLVSLCLGFLISLLIWVGAQFNPAFLPVNGSVAILIIILIPISLANLLFQNILLGLQEVRAYNKIEIFNKFLVFFLVASSFLLNYRKVEIILAATLTGCSLCLYFIWRKIQVISPIKPRLSGAFFRKSFFYGFRSYIAALFAFLVIRSDILMVKYFLGFEQTGYYSIAANIADIISMLPAIIGTILFPRIVGITDQRKRLEVVKKTAFGVLILMSCLGLLCFSLAKIVILSLLGEAFLPAVPALLWLLPGLILLSVNVIFMNYFASVGIPWIMIVSPAVAALSNIFMNAIMIPSMGIIGASISSTICYASMLAMSLLYLKFNKIRKESYSQM